MKKNYKKNPLLEFVPDFADFSDIGKSLEQLMSPVNNLAGLTALQRRNLLMESEIPYKPTRQSIEVALNILSMVRASYRTRNPMLNENKLLRNKMLGSAQSNNVSYGKSSIQVIMGITGTGKSILIERLRSLFPKQLVQHKINKDAGWIAQNQIFYLYVEMSHDGSRGGFINNILLALDGVLGTDHAITVPKQFRTLDKQTGKTIQILHANYVGVLFIDEIQKRNMTTSSQAELMQLFILLIMNSGIVTVLSGNPLGFTWMSNFSQDIRRLNANPIAYLHPLYKNNETDKNNWQIIFSGISQLYVLPKHIPNLEDVGEYLRQLAGGIPGFGFSIWKGTQNELILSGKEMLTKQDLLNFYESDKFLSYRPIADGFSTRNAKLLSVYDDIPHEDYQRLWSRDEDTTVHNSSGIDEKKVGQYNCKKVSEKTKFKSKQTKEKNRKLRKKKIKDSLTEKDIRKIGTIEKNLAGLQKLKNKFDNE